jgi:hypothetical protein
VLDGVGDIIRTTRNDSGHPTGRVLTKDQARVNLQIFGPYLERLDGLRRYFEQTHLAPNDTAGM